MYLFYITMNKLLVLLFLIYTFTILCNANKTYYSVKEGESINLTWYNFNFTLHHRLYTNLIYNPEIIVAYINLWNLYGTYGLNTCLYKIHYVNNSLTLEIIRAGMYDAGTYRIGKGDDHYFNIVNLTVNEDISINKLSSISELLKVYDDNKKDILLYFISINNRLELINNTNIKDRLESNTYGLYSMYSSNCTLLGKLNLTYDYLDTTINIDTIDVDTSNDYTSNDYTSNGYTSNGYTSNGYTSNGYTSNGYTSNGYTFNGYTFNGYTFNGYTSNDYTTNSSTSNHIIYCLYLFKIYIFICIVIFIK